MELWEELAVQGYGGKGWGQCAAAWSSIALGQGTWGSWWDVGRERTNQPQVSEEVRSEAQSGTSYPLIKARQATEAGLGGWGSPLGRAGSSFDTGAPRACFGAKKGLEP